MIAGFASDQKIDFLLIGDPLVLLAILFWVLQQEAVDLELGQDLFVDQVFGRSDLIDWAEHPFDD